MNPEYSWDENLEPNIQDYRLYVSRVSGVYTALAMAPGSPKNMGNNLEGTFFIDDEQQGRYFAVLTCRNTSNQESFFSAEFSQDVSLLGRGFSSGIKVFYR